MYFAVIGDLVNSKKLDGRPEVQVRLKQALQAVNETYAGELASKFTVTLGDEFQGLLRTPIPLFEIIERIRRELHPVGIRFGVGFGAIVTAIDPELAIGADGPAYHHARRMIDEMKAEERGWGSRKTSLKFCAEGTRLDEAAQALNLVFPLLTFLESRWSARQREIIDAFFASGGSQRGAAQQLGIGQSSVQRGLKAAGFYPYQSAKNGAAELLIESWRRQDD